MVFINTLSFKQVAFWHSILTIVKGTGIKVEVANVCVSMDTLIDQDVVTDMFGSFDLVRKITYPRFDPNGTRPEGLVTKLIDKKMQPGSYTPTQLSGIVLCPMDNAWFFGSVTLA